MARSTLLPRFLLAPPILLERLAFALGTVELRYAPALWWLYWKLFHYDLARDLWDEKTADYLYPWSGREVTLRLRGPEPRTLVLPEDRNAIAVFNEIFRKHDYRPPRVTPEPEVVVDAGANLGLATLYFSRIYPRARFVCYEPAPANFVHLQKNLALNPRVKAKVVAKALADHEGTADFYLSKHAGSHSLERIDATAKQKVRVKVATLDRELVRLRLAGKRLFIKVDVEGTELALFRGARRTLSSAVAVVGEISRPVDAPAVRELLARAGLRMEMKSDTLFSARR